MAAGNVPKKARSVKEASSVLYNCSSRQKNALLKAIVFRLRDQIPEILQANKKDLKSAAAAKLSDVLTDRLTLN